MAASQPIAPADYDANLPVDALAAGASTAAEDRPQIEGWALVTGGNAEALSNAIGGWAAQARRNRVGLLISPQSMTDGEAIGVRLRRRQVGGAPQAGRAYLHLGDGVLQAVQIPHTTLE
jgi:hypothetical protein